MLPKPDKFKKNTSSSEQLDLVNTLSADDKIRHKRRFLIISLVLTFGLSFSFWFYTSLKKSSFSFSNFSANWRISAPRFELPNFSFSKSFNPRLKLDSNSWSIYLSTIPQTLTWSKNYDLSTPSPIISDLEKLPSTQNSFIKSALPEGTEIKERITESQDSFEIQSLVIIPQKQILFLIKVAGPDLSSSKSLIPSIISTLYWSLMQSN